MEFIFTIMYRLVYVVVVAAASLVDAKTLPSYIVPCKRDDPNINKCAKEHAINAIPRLLKGDREYKIPVLLPLHISEIILNPTPDFTLKLRNISLIGLDSFVVKDIIVDLERQHIEFIVYFNSVEFGGQYEMDGRVLVLPIKGNGPAKVRCDGLNMNYSFNYGLVTKNGKEYIDSENFVPVVNYTVKKIVLKFDNLFNGDKNLGDRTNEFLNEHATEINHDFSPAISEAVEKIATDIIKKIIPIVPYDQIFL